MNGFHYFTKFDVTNQAVVAIKRFCKMLDVFLQEEEQWLAFFNKKASVDANKVITFENGCDIYSEFKKSKLCNHLVRTPACIVFPFILVRFFDEEHKNGSDIWWGWFFRRRNDNIYTPEEVSTLGPQGFLNWAKGRYQQFYN